MIEITLDELNKLQKDTYQIFDIRNDESFSYGSLPGAVHLPQNVLEADMEKDMPGVIKNFPEGKTSVLVCQRGQQSREIAEKLNVSPQNVAQQEQRGITKISTAMQYATILNCNWTDLIDEPAPRARN